jgi:hypothetical protein
VRLQRLGDLLQAEVAGGVAEGVVVQLEMVDVEHDQRQRLGVADRALPFLFQESVEVAAVGDLGQRVQHGGALQRILELLVVGDVVQQGDEQAVGRVHRRHRQVHRAQAAVAVADQYLAGAVADRFHRRAAVRIGVLPGQQLGQRAAHQFVRRIAEVAVAGRVRVLDAAAALDDQEALVHAVDDHAQAVRLFLLGVAAAGQAQLGAHAGADFFHAQRLGNVIGGADVETGHDVLGLAARAHEDHRNARRGRVGFHAAAGFQSVHAGQDDVEQHQVGLDALGDLERALTRSGDEGLVTLAQHHRAQQGEIVRRVVDDENGRLVGRGEPRVG